MPNQDWEISTRYDYRFVSLMVQAKHAGAISPLFNISIKDLLKNIPEHELRACMLPDSDSPASKGVDIEPYRRAAIRDTELTGKVVLDVGGYDGWASALALECGAARAICLDNQQYRHYGWEDKKHDGVEYITGDLTSLTLDQTGEWLNAPDSWAKTSIDLPDIIINYNVLYHVKNPWAFLDRCRELINPAGTMLLCTLFRYHDGPWMYIYEPHECNPDDDTVYFGPSITALERLLRLTGWDIQQEGVAYDRVVYRCIPTANWQRKHEDT